MNPRIKLVPISPGLERFRGRIDLEHDTIQLVILDLTRPCHESAAHCRFPWAEAEIAFLVAPLTGVHALVVVSASRPRSSTAALCRDRS